MGLLRKCKDILQIAFPSKQKAQKSKANDIENGKMGQHGTSEASTQRVLVDAYGRPELDPSDNLNLFRHLTGIISHPSMSHSDTFFSSGGRPAPNLGIYARVIHNEGTAKVGYKYFSWLINGCLGLQIVVAAALTALGAAGGSRGAVTVFGAINTVFAGILTFLKGSGLPNRFKYYQTEWKRVREFIEQRERDFSRPDCNLDVHAVVAMVESMYDEVKTELEASTPDRFAGHNSARKSLVPPEAAPVYKFPSMSLPRVESVFEKGKEVEAGVGSKVKNLASEIGHYAQQAREVAKDIQAHKDNFATNASREVKEYADRAERIEHAFGVKVKDLATEIEERAHSGAGGSRC
ncbi:hypothetical protein ONS95_005522 [Cadophora gregata]|uniref:uncharacterized protein n=1 Tax=Cadophora gregata TaxID=51156 RepID=UPI0026DC70AB|nr:uncharacterized protein ONS95_005522 [Cadophora gregata]KAK0103501.1 hypothetical protein ONS95_005522 [Cadophora gregata]KAK0107693.1 hypothetical protein ONS96_003494 [Cadophora gregata f. sp. sojae]